VRLKGWGGSHGSGWQRGKKVWLGESCEGMGERQPREKQPSVHAPGVHKEGSCLCFELACPRNGHGKTVRCTSAC
jgi:hypothetical protein